MTAENPGRRKITAREAAEKLGVSPRTVTRIMAEPRDDFLARAAERRQAVLELRRQGLKYVQIGAELGLSTGAVGRLLRDAKRYAEQAGETVTLDLGVQQGPNGQQLHVMVQVSADATGHDDAQAEARQAS